MWFMNNIANPFVRLILRSPFHRLMSADLLLITYQGRKSGKSYTLPVQYGQRDRTIYIVPGSPEQKTWWRNLRGGLPVQVVLRGEALSGYGFLLDPVADSGIVISGLGQYLRHFPSLARFYHVRTDARGALDAADLGRAADSLVMIRVELNQS